MVLGDHSTLTPRISMTSGQCFKSLLNWETWVDMRLITTADTYFLSIYWSSVFILLKYSCFSVVLISAAAVAKSLQSCPTLQPHRRKPTRLPRPWDSPGKDPGKDCHFFLQCMKVKSEREVAQLCPTLSDPMDYSLPASSVHGIFQARVLEWGVIAFSSVNFCYTTKWFMYTHIYSCSYSFLLWFITGYWI